MKMQETAAYQIDAVIYLEILGIAAVQEMPL